MKRNLDKILIASDLHGSETYTRRLLVRFDAENAGLLVLLGDLYYHGPRNPLPEGYAPAEVAKLLNARKSDILAVRGNCDSSVDETISEFPITESAQLVFGGRRAFLTHGDVWNFDRLPSLPAGSLFFQGHTHVGEIRTIGEILCVNPGSVSLPKGGSERGYVLLESGRVVRKSLDGVELDTKSLR